ncbi:AmiS/UreI family transporter [Pseudonocardia sp. NPDC049154]|uniref:AmiS/UreI family transporter n=1 Tax=Pseudonocardia sp. NPDC049154 TaxID=3155501 RepID=UPI0033FE4FC6
MLLAVVLLYVGAVLAVNGIWLVGQARAAEEAERVPAHAAAVAGEPAEVPSSVGGRGAEPASARRERSPLFLQNREVAVINIFTGFVGVVIALIFLVQGAVGNNLAAARGGGFILLFAFTYLWVAFNQYLNAGGRAFGWYCLFVAITAVPAGIYTLQNANGNIALLWLGINWFLWAILWALFWALLALERPIARPTGLLAIFEGVATSWALGFAVLIGVFSF